MEEYADEIDLGSMFRTVWNGKWLILVLGSIGLAVAYFFATQVAEPAYRATATVAFEGQQQQVTGFEDIFSGISSDQPSLNTQIHVIQSRQLLERLVHQESLLEDPEFNPTLAQPRAYSLDGLKTAILGAPEPLEMTEDEHVRVAVDRVRARLSVANPRQSYVFEISMTTGSPEKSARLANAIAELYTNDQLVVKEMQSQRAIAFLTERTAELQRELSQAELDVKNFAASTDLVSAETLAAKNTQVKDLRSRLEELGAVATAQEAHLTTLREFDIATATISDVQDFNDPILIRAFRRFQNGDIDNVAMQTAVERSIGLAQQTLTQTRTQFQSLTDAVTELEEEVAAQSRDLLYLQQLQREADATGDIYLYFLTRLKEAEVQQGTQQSDARVLSAAVLPQKASSPRIPLILGSGLIFGLILGTVLAFVKEMMSGGIRVAEDLEKLTGRTVLGQIPVAPIRKRSALIDYISKRSNSAFTEAVRNLRTSILLSNPDKPAKSIMLTSSVPAEGKTTTSIALAHSLAGMGKSVLLIEVDVRRLTLRHYIEAEKGINLLDATKQGADIGDLKEQANFVEELGLWVMQGGETKINAADFFSSDHFVQFLERAEACFDHVVLDAPPILPVADARIVGQNTDVILYCCAWDETRPEVVRSGLAEFSAAGLTPTGLIFTKIDPAKARRYGGATRYGSYYGSYSKGYYT